MAEQVYLIDLTVPARGTVCESDYASSFFRRETRPSLSFLVSPASN